MALLGAKKVLKELVLALDLTGWFWATPFFFGVPSPCLQSIDTGSREQSEGYGTPRLQLVGSTSAYRHTQRHHVYMVGQATTDSLGWNGVAVSAGRNANSILHYMTEVKEADVEQTQCCTVFMGWALHQNWNMADKVCPESYQEGVLDVVTLTVSWKAHLGGHKHIGKIRGFFYLTVSMHLC
jgi:hypothetical protein